MSLVLRRYAVPVLVAVAIAAVPLPLVGQSKPIVSSTPIGQMSVGGEAAVPIYSLAFGASQPETFGQPTIQDVAILKQSDALSAALLRYLLTGAYLQTVRIDVFQKGSVTVGTTLDLVNVRLTSFQAAGGEITESVTMRFDRVIFGSGGQSVCWDIAQNRAC